MKKTKDLEPEKDENGRRIITPAYIKKLCHQNEQYDTPSLNEILYLHFKGFSKISSLNEYVNLTTLHLEKNSIQQIEGLEALKNLRYLFLQNNKIKDIANINHLSKLVTLNLSENLITQIAPGCFKGLESLQTLNLSSNYIQTYETLKHIQDCPSITDLNLADNDIEYDEKVIQLMKQLPSLGCLYLVGNPLSDKCKSYRKKLIVILDNLKFLDKSPVKVEERRFARAWLGGGKEAEFLERLKASEEKQEVIFDLIKETEDKLNERLLKQQILIKKFENNLLKKKEELVTDKRRLEMVMRFEEAKKVDQELQQIEIKLQNKENIIIEELNDKDFIQKFSSGTSTIDENGKKIMFGMDEKEYEKYQEERADFLMLKHSNHIPEHIQEERKTQSIGNLDNKNPETNESNSKRVQSLQNTSNDQQFQSPWQVEGINDWQSDIIEDINYLLRRTPGGFERVQAKMEMYITSLKEGTRMFSDLLDDQEFRSLWTIMQSLQRCIDKKHRR